MKLRRTVDGADYEIDSRDIIYKYGAWVVYYKTNPIDLQNAEFGEDLQIGRVVEDCGAAARVCYHTGCTSALTQKDFLRPATEEEIQRHGDPNIGYNRFFNACPDMDPAICGICIHTKFHGLTGK